MPDVDALPIIADVVDITSDLFGSDNADDEVQNATQQANDTQWKMYQQMRSDLQPYLTGGVESWNRYLDNLGTTPEAGELWTNYKNYINQGMQFSGVDDPSLQYVQDEALKATERSASAKTGVLSGATQKALQENAGNIANTYWQNAYNNALQKYTTQAGLLGGVYNTYQNNRNNYLQQLLSAATMGQNAGTATGSAGLSTGNALASNSLLSGLSSANSSVSSANALSGGVNSLLSNLSTLLGGGSQTSRTSGYGSNLLSSLFN